MNEKIYNIYYKDHPHPFRFGSYQAILRSLTAKDLVLRLFKDSRLNNQTYERLLRTRQLVRTLIYFGLESKEGQAAIQLINAAHRYVEADNDDYLYVLSTFFLEPFEWDACFSRRRISDDEKQTVLLFWQEIGTAMHIANFPDSLEAWVDFQKAYEEKHMAYSVEGRRIAHQSIAELSRQAFPNGLHRLGRQVLLATLNPKIQECLKLPRSIIPSRLVIVLLEKFKPNFEPKRDIIERVASENSP